MSKENHKFTVLHIVRYSFDTQDEADNFAKFMKSHCDGYFVSTLNDEENKDEQK